MKKVLFALLISSNLLAQDPIFTMGYSSSMYLNPALTGQQKGYKVNANYRNQWPDISGNFITSSVGIQKKLDSLSGGIGLLFEHDDARQGTLFTINLGLSLSKSWKISPSLEISIGTIFNYQQKAVDWSKLTFGDMIDPKLGFVNTNNSTTPNTTVSYFNLSSGILFTHPLFNIGFVACNITQPNQSFYEDGVARLPIRFNLHSTYDIRVTKDFFVISPSVIMNSQADFQSLIAGVTTRYKWAKFYTGYSNSNALIGGLGLALPYFSIHYLYEYTISALTNSTGGSHEVALSFRFGTKKDFASKGINAL